MLNTTVNAIIEDRARFARELEYLKEMAKDDLIDECIEMAENNFVKESVEELVDAGKAVEMMSSEDSVAEEREIKNILESKDDITFDEMIDLNMLVERTE